MARARENTLEAFALAPADGADGLESDVWLTRDGVSVLFAPCLEIHVPAGSGAGTA